MEIKRIQSNDSKNLEIALKNLQNKLVKVGWFEGSKYDDKHQTPVATVAAQNEYGNPNKKIPARPFLRPTIIEQEKAWRKTLLDGSREIIKGNISLDFVLEGFGQQVTGDIKKKITQIYEPPLSPATIAKRLQKYKNKKLIGSLDKPLIETGILYNTITHNVENL